MPITLTSVSPNQISGASGVLVEIHGVFVLGHRYRARVGDTLLSIDASFHSGIAGQGNILYPFTTGILRAYSPYLRPSVGVTIPYSIHVVDLDTTEEGYLLESVEVLPGSYHDATYNLRKVLPVHYLTGARSAELER